MTPAHAKTYADRVIAPHLKKDAEDYAITVYEKARHCWNVAGASFCRMGYKGHLIVGDVAWCSTIVSIRWRGRGYVWREHDNICWCAGEEPRAYAPRRTLAGELRTLARLKRSATARTPADG